ncbi:MAG: gliding motility lipoprotein GldH [Chitinophagaceae bacterium]
MYYRITLFISLIVCLLLQACLQSSVYEKHIDIAKFQWNTKDVCSYDIDITDTTAQYQIFLMLRHTDEYNFSNIILKIETQAPDKTLTSVTTDIPLAEDNGKWLARGMEEIYEHKMPLTKNGSPLVFNQKGIYNISIQHIMRENPLDHIMSVGIRLEKINKQP